MEVAEVSRTKFDPYVIGNNIRDLREKENDTDEGGWGNGYEFMSLCTNWGRLKGMSIQMLLDLLIFTKLMQIRF